MRRATVMVLLPALAALFAPGAARAQPLPADCQAYTRASSGASELVRHWLAHAADDHVIVCGAADGAAPPQYSAESPVTHAQGVCSYSSHGLTAVGRGEQRQLRRYEQADALHMALAAGTCPAPHGAAASYTETYDV